ncbi:hypothetical protein F7725_026023 [Dissostichus mawsoni]|uniref:Ig-like domain-containing protein n=1 Tax=Dissostichus mawsoni TaxID=36200 RepID=A0A7J5X7E0_DISMA|nr:hypothetical protein F7725_026023 [Dissostichus mawsoni]
MLLLSAPPLGLLRCHGWPALEEEEEEEEEEEGRGREEEEASCSLLRAKGASLSDDTSCFPPMSLRNGPWYCLAIQRVKQCVQSFSKPKINATDQIVLTGESPVKPVTLQCNLTTAHTPHRESFW